MVRRMKRRRKQPIPARKKRTREHVIADMSLHHLGYRVVECGFTMEGVVSDYGYDATVFTFDRSGQMENGNIYVQLKATEAIKLSVNGRTVRFSISKKDLNLWQDEFMPVYLVVFDVRRGVAYWVYLQQYLEKNGISAARLTKSLTVKIDVRNVVDAKAIHGWRADKQKIVTQLKKKKVKHA